MSSLNKDLKDNSLFFENKPGGYNYYSTGYGKVAEGYLIHEKGERNNKNQLNAGGKDREISDDGGHLISTANKGSSGPENIDAQNKNLNRGSYKIRENIINKEIDAGNKVYEHVETFKSNNSERPDAYMGYYIVENENGERYWDAFSYTNVNVQEQEEWNQIIEDMDLDESINNVYEISSEMVDDLNNEYDQLISESNYSSVNENLSEEASNEIE